MSASIQTPSVRSPWEPAAEYPPALLIDHRTDYRYELSNAEADRYEQTGKAPPDVLDLIAQHRIEVEIDLAKRVSSERYSAPFHHGSHGQMVKCKECSTPQAKVLIPASQRSLHDHEHANEVTATHKHPVPPLRR